MGLAHDMDGALIGDPELWMIALAIPLKTDSITLRNRAPAGSGASSVRGELCRALYSAE
jgi:hypothetical protein